MDNDIAIKVDNVYKNFKLPHEKTNSIKSLITGIGKKRRKGYENQHALKDISFKVKKGEFFGIVGRNGSGKSTLLKIIAEIYQPTKGIVLRNGRLVPFIELGVGFNPELTGRENIYLNGALLGFSTKEIDAMYDDIVDFAELERFMDQKLKNYSSGMQVRLAFSVATRANADILLIDEVLAVGDADFQRKCFEYFKHLKKSKTTVVFVSHDMAAIKEFCDRAVLIEKSEIVKSGNSRDVALEYSKLFSTASPKATVKGDRWGNNDVSMDSIDAKVDEKHITIDIGIVVNKQVDKLIYGVHVNGPDGAELTAANNRMLDMPDITSLQPGEHLNLQWEIQNVFNDGDYTVTLTLIDDAANTLDWWVDAVQFQVRRIQRSTTAVLPPIKSKYSTQGHKGKS